MANIVPLHAQNPPPEKALPHNLDAEAAVLGGILMNNAAYAKIADILDKEDFYEPVHAEFYDACQNLITSGRTASAITMQSIAAEMDFGRDEHGEMVTGKFYLARLAGMSVGMRDVIDLAKMLKDCAIRRRLFIKMEEMQARILADKPKDGAAAILAELETELTDVRLPTGEARQEFQPFSHAADRAVVIAERTWKRGGVLAGLSTGLHKLDDICGGLAGSDLIVLGGRPAMGKTSLAVNIAYNVARELMRLRDEEKDANAGVVGIFSLEMSSDQLAQRILAEHSRVSGWRVRRGKISQDEMTGFAESSHVLRSLPIEIDHTGSIPLPSLVMRARQLHKRKTLRLLVVDYLQLVKAPATGRGRDRNRVDEVTEITGALKALAKELDIPIIALSQLSRKVEERDDKRPKLSDLRESGSVEQDADGVWFVYREHYYLSQAKPTRGSVDELTKWAEAMDRYQRVGDVIIEKNRHGPIDTVTLGWDPSLTQFNNDVPVYEEKPKEDKAKRDAKPAKINLPKQATIAYQLLKSLALPHSIENDGQIDAAPKDAKLIPYSIWRTKCGEEFFEAKPDEKKLTAAMEKAFIALRAPGEGNPPMVGRGFLNDVIYVWLLGKTK